MVEELKVNVCLTLDIDSGLNKKDLNQYLKDNLMLKAHPFIDVVNIQIINNNKEINY